MAEIRSAATSSSPRVSVIVPSWRRPESLARCLRALAAQAHRPDQVVIAIRVDDDATARAARDAFAETGLNVTLAPVTGPGVIAAMNAALERCDGDLVALTDDDAEPRADWLARIVAAFADPRVGGVGGRDWQPHERGDRTTVGIVQWFGRVIGNHHLGSGPARDVDVLKGVNLALRAPLLQAARFDERLRGTGAQMFWELALCLPVRRAGWRLVYDPAIAVDHHVEPRHDTDLRHRGAFSSAPQVDAVHNETLILLENLGSAARLAFIAWALAIGTRNEPGLAQVPRLALRGEGQVVARWIATVRGRIAGFESYATAGGTGPAIPAPPR